MLVSATPVRPAQGGAGSVSWRSLGRAKARNSARSSRGLTSTMADSSAINRYNVKLPTVVGLDNFTCPLSG